MGRTVTIDVADVTVEGVVQRVSESNGVVYLRFGAPGGSFSVSCPDGLGTGVKYGDSVRVLCDVVMFGKSMALQAVKVEPVVPARAEVK